MQCTTQIRSNKHHHFVPEGNRLLGLGNETPSSCSIKKAHILPSNTSSITNRCVWNAFDKLPEFIVSPRPKCCSIEFQPAFSMIRSIDSYTAILKCKSPILKHILSKLDANKLIKTCMQYMVKRTQNKMRCQKEH